MPASGLLERLADLFARRGVPEHVRSDNGPEFTAEVVRGWLGRVGLKTLFIEPGSPWENGCVESFNGKLRDDLPDREAFDTLPEAKVLIGRWRVRDNTVRSQSSLGHRPPAPEAVTPWTDRPRHQHSLWRHRRGQVKRAGRGRWVVERTISSLKGLRRMWARCNRLLDVREDWNTYASVICYRRLHDELPVAG